MLPMARWTGGARGALAAMDGAGGFHPGGGGGQGSWVSLNHPSLCVCVYVLGGDLGASILIPMNFTVAFGALNANAITHRFHHGHFHPIFKVLNRTLAEMAVQPPRRTPLSAPTSGTVSKDPWPRDPS